MNGTSQEPQAPQPYKELIPEAIQSRPKQNDISIPPKSQIQEKKVLDPKQQETLVVTLVGGPENSSSMILSMPLSATRIEQMD